MERELALHVPATSRSAVAQLMQVGNAQSIELHARYFDTSTRELARAGIALRLRKEGEQWVQTLKAPGSDALSRIEINHERNGPELDLSLYEGSEIADRLAQLSEPLALRYETQVTRLVAIAEVGKADIEIAYDQGKLLAQDLELPISEVEFELKSGPIDTMLDLSRHWLLAYNLVLESRSKSHRGDALAQAALQARNATPEAGNEHQPQALFNARRARAIKLTNSMSMAELYQACASECLMQIVANAALAAGVDTADASQHQQVEYIHQLRVGIRRLRSCWKLFEPWVALPDRALIETLKSHFELFGESRDSDVIKLEIEPQLMQAGMPELTLPTQQEGLADSSTSLAAGSPAFQAALLGLLRHQINLSETAQTLADATPRKKAERPGKQLIQRLKTWTGTIAKEGRSFASLPEEEQHDLRKKAKALRYSLDFCENLLPRQRLHVVLGSLNRIQSLLGDLNDYYVAQNYYSGLTDEAPQAWFALGWLRAMQSQRISQAQAEFKLLKQRSLNKR